MKILLVSDFFPPDFRGGAEISARRLADRLVQAGFEVVVCTGYVGRSSVGLEDGIMVYRVLKRITPRVHQFVLFDLWNPFAEKELKKILMNEKPDIIHFHLLHGISFRLIPFSKRVLPGSKVVTTLHNYWFACVNSKLLNKGKICTGFERGCKQCYLPLVAQLLLKYKKWCLGYSDAIIAPSEYVGKIAISTGVLPKKIYLIRLGVEPAVRVVKIGNRKEEHILFVGRIVKSKGVNLLLEAYNKIEDANTFLDIVGIGEELENVKKFAKDLHLENVHFWEKVESVEEFYNNCDILVIPSTWPDNLPLVPVEAMFHKKPVIATNVGGLPEIVEHNKTGLIVEPGDVEGLAGALLRLVRDEALRRRFGEAGYRKALEEYSWDATFRQTVELYEDLAR